MVNGTNSSFSTIHLLLEVVKEEMVILPSGLVQEDQEVLVVAGSNGPATWWNR
jgi:hypothetical protein